MINNRGIMTYLFVCVASLLVACNAPQKDQASSSGTAEKSAVSSPDPWGSDQSGAVSEPEAKPTPTSTPIEVTVDESDTTGMGEYLNLRDAKLAAVVPINKEEFEKIQDVDPHRTTMQLVRLPKADDWISLTKAIPVKDSTGTYHLEGTIENPWENTQRGENTLIFQIMINGNEAYVVDLARDSAPIKVKINDIKPVNGEISIEYMISCKKTNEKPSWRTASKVSLYQWQLAKD